MKRILSILALSLAVLAPAAYAQTAAPAQSAEDAEEEALDYAYELIVDGLHYNESCKPILDPKHYEGFKIIFHIDLEAMGASPEDIEKADKAGALLSGYICEGKSECWRTVLEMPATATVEEGRSKCASIIIDILAEVDEIVNPDKRGS